MIPVTLRFPDTDNLSVGLVSPTPRFPESVRDIKTFAFPFNQLKLLVPVRI